MTQKANTIFGNVTKWWANQNSNAPIQQAVSNFSNALVNGIDGVILDDNSFDALIASVKNSHPTEADDFIPLTWYGVGKILSSAFKKNENNTSDGEADKEYCAQILRILSDEINIADKGHGNSDRIKINRIPFTPDTFIEMLTDCFCAENLASKMNIQVSTAATQVRNQEARVYRY